MIDEVREAPNELDCNFKEYHLFMRITPEERSL
jgi:hypothetical protein